MEIKNEENQNISNRLILPSFDENDVAHQNFIFKSCAESAFWTAQVLLDHSSNSGHRSDGRALELRHLEAAVKHALDEGSLLEDLVRLTGQFELLDNLGGLVHLENDSGGRDPEVGLHVSHGLHGQKTWE